LRPVGGEKLATPPSGQIRDRGERERQDGTHPLRLEEQQAAAIRRNLTLPGNPVRRGVNK
jgi:hypothetical protein